MGIRDPVLDLALCLDRSIYYLPKDFTDRRIGTGDKGRVPVQLRQEKSLTILAKNKVSLDRGKGTGAAPVTAVVAVVV